MTRDKVFAALRRHAIAKPQWKPRTPTSVFVPWTGSRWEVVALSVNA